MVSSLSTPVRHAQSSAGRHRGAGPLESPGPGTAHAGKLHRSGRRDRPHRSPGDWILRHACRQWQHWQKTCGLPLRLAVNLTSRQFQSDSLANDIQTIIKNTGLPPQCLELEITEGTLMQNAASADRILRQLKELGVQLGIDDFGTGYFSLAYLQNLPIDRLKIDPSFVQGGPGDTNHASIVTTIIDLARNMDLQLIAEGVESASQIDFLLKKGCHIGQGYYFAEPLDSNGIESLIDRLPAVSHGADNLRPYLSNRANNY